MKARIVDREEVEMSDILCKCGHNVNRHTRGGCQHYESGKEKACMCNQKPSDFVAALRDELARKDAVKSAWQEFAEHQITCAACAESCYECDTGLSLMLAISKVEDKPNQWIDGARVEDALKGTQ